MFTALMTLGFLFVLCYAVLLLKQQKVRNQP